MPVLTPFIVDLLQYLLCNVTPVTRAVFAGVQNMSMSQDKWSDADALELDLEEVMRIVQNAEVYLG